METMKRIGVALLSAFGGYIVGVPLGLFLVENLSTNRHDKSKEAAMTAGFVIAPLDAEQIILEWKGTTRDRSARSLCDSAADRPGR